MNNVIVACTLISLSSVAVIPNNDAQAQILSYDNTNDGAGNYRFSFETSNGIMREETGRLVNVGQKDEHIVVEGSYFYTDVDGNVVVVTYTADENGFRFNPISPVSIASLPGSVVASLLGK